MTTTLMAALHLQPPEHVKLEPHLGLARQSRFAVALHALAGMQAGHDDMCWVRSFEPYSQEQSWGPSSASSCISST